MTETKEGNRAHTRCRSHHNRWNSKKQSRRTVPEEAYVSSGSKRQVYRAWTIWNIVNTFPYSLWCGLNFSSNILNNLFTVSHDSWCTHVSVCMSCSPSLPTRSLLLVLFCITNINVSYFLYSVANLAQKNEESAAEWMVRLQLKRPSVNTKETVGGWKRSFIKV